MAKDPKKLTTASGASVDDDQNAMTAGPHGPALMQDVHLMETLAHFNRERIPERVVHAKGAGAHGVFLALYAASAIVSCTSSISEMRPV